MKERVTPIRMGLGLWLFVLLFPALLLAQDSPAEGPTTPPISGEGVETISPDEVYRGQKGYGFSVFAGSEPERFELEVIGVLRNSTPELSYILTRLSGHDLERTGVVAGMSGSPVYIDGRLAGAVSFGYSFGLDPIAGIMPIGAMRSLSSIDGDARGKGLGSQPGNIRPARTVPFDPEFLLQKELPIERLTTALERLRPPMPQGARAAALWSATGFGLESEQLLQQAVGPLAPMGGSLQQGASGGNPDLELGELVPGSAVSSVLVQGDLSLAIHGTVTDRRGDEILAFGHPLFASGPVSLPMGHSEVVTIIGNQTNSFKVSNAGQVVGVFDQDREAGVRGFLGGEAPMFPMKVRLRGMAEAAFEMKIAEIPDLAPSLVAIAALGAVNSSTYSAGAQGLELRARMSLEGYDDLVIEQTFDGNQAVLQSVIYLLGVVQFLQLNALEQVDIEAIDLEYEQNALPGTRTLVSARPARNLVRPGERVSITLEVQPYRGGPAREVVEYVIPKDAPEGNLILLLGDGANMDGARLLVEPRVPETMEQTLDQLNSYRSRRELEMFALRPGAGLAFGGEVLPDLPPSMLAILGSSGSEVATSLSLRLYGAKQQTMDWPMDGLLRIDLEVVRDP